MKCQISIVVITLLSAIKAQNFYGFGSNSLFPGFSNPFGFPGFTSPVQPQYVTSMQQQRLTRMAQQQHQQKMLAMNQLTKPQPQMNYAGYKWPKWPVYKPQYSYTKAMQSFIRPQPQFANQPSTKLQATSTFNHIVKPSISTQYNIPSKINPLPSQSQTIKNFLSPQPVKYTHLYNYIPKTQTMKPIVVTPKNYIPFQGPKNTISYQSPFANYQYNYKNTLSLPPASNSLTFKSPQSIVGYQPQRTILTTQAPKNILTLQAPKSNVMLSTPSSQKSSTSTQSVSSTSTEIKYHLPVMQVTPKPQTYSKFLGQSLVKNEPSAPGMSFTNQMLTSTASKTVLTPVKSETDKGPIHTIPAPNLSIGKPSMGYKPLAHHSPFYSYQPIKTPSYEVTEPSSEKFNSLSQQYNPPTIVKVPQKTVINPMSNFSPSMPMFPNQPSSQSMSSQELYDLMNNVTPQQQLTDSYGMPLQQQPQLQQHFMQQANVPLQPFNAIIQPVYGNNMHENSAIYKPDPKYTQKMYDHYINQGSVMQPMYHMPKINKMEMIKAEAAAMANQHDSSNIHYNVVRNTKEGSMTTNKIETNSKEDKNTSQNINVKNGKQLSIKNVENNDFLPTSLPDVSNELTASKPVSASYFAEASGPDISMSTYFAPLTNKEVEETLASIQEAARDMIKDNKETTTHQNNFMPPSYQTYFGQTSHLNDAYYSFIPQSNNDFIPIVGSYETVAINDDTNDQNNLKNEAPIRIYVPDHYDDNEVPATHDISISASMNAQENDSQQNVVGSYTVDNQQNLPQSYVEYPQVIAKQENVTTADPVKNAEYTSTSVNNSPTNTEDIFVLLQTNNTDPSLDILTKDWKTSIVIKRESKDNGVVSTQSSETSSEFGNRLRPKRNQ